ERFWDIDEGTVSRRAKEILEQLVTDRYSVLLVTSNKYVELREKFSSRYRALIRSLPRQTFNGLPEPWRSYPGVERDRFGDYFRNAHQEIAANPIFEDLPACMKMDEFETLITLTRRSEQSDAHAILLEVLRS